MILSIPFFSYECFFVILIGYFAKFECFGSQYLKKVLIELPLKKPGITSTVNYIKWLGVLNISWLSKNSDYTVFLYFWEYGKFPDYPEIWIILYLFTSKRMFLKGM